MFLFKLKKIMTWRKSHFFVCEQRTESVFLQEISTCVRKATPCFKNCLCLKNVIYNVVILISLINNLIVNWD